MSFLSELKIAQAELAARETDHPWKQCLQRVQGKVDYDGLARVSTQTLLDILEVPQNRRTAGTYRLLARLMAELGWTAVRVRDMTRGGYLEQVRGYCRNTRQGRYPTAPDQEHAPVVPV
jgi:hypothetical protein